MKVVGLQTWARAGGPSASPGMAVAHTGLSTSLKEDEALVPRQAQ